MRILKKKSYEKVHKCPNCKSLIAYTPQDIVRDLFDNKFIICPVCRDFVWISIFDRKVKK